MDTGKLLTCLGVLLTLLTITKTSLEIIKLAKDVMKKDEKKQTHKPRTPRKRRRGK